MLSYFSKNIFAGVLFSLTLFIGVQHVGAQNTEKEKEIDKAIIDAVGKKVGPRAKAIIKEALGLETTRQEVIVGRQNFRQALWLYYSLPDNASEDRRKLAANRVRRSLDDVPASTFKTLGLLFIKMTIGFN